MDYMHFDRIGEITLSYNHITWNKAFIDYFLRNNEAERSVFVSKGSVKRLINICDEIMEYHKNHPNDNTKAQELLPSNELFDNEYYNTINDMKNFLKKKLIKEFDKIKNDNEFIKLYY